MVMTSRTRTLGARPDWTPQFDASGSKPRYLAFVEALARDIDSGALKPGTRLLPQRGMAAQLGLSLGTISRAYAEAEARGLISGEVGRGTFVQRRTADASGKAPEMVNLALNVPPPTGEEDVIAGAVGDILADGGLKPLLDYLPHQGLATHRVMVGEWLAGQRIVCDVNNLLITNGGQHALSIAASLIAQPGQPVLTERFTYSGMTALAAQSRYVLHGVDGDEHGLLPDQLDRAFRETGARALFATPTLQTPIGTVMPAERRQAIAAIVRRHDAYLIEDDVYAFLLETPPQPIAMAIPERTFYVTSFAKCLAPGLRIGAMVVPDSFRDRGINGVRATGWMASPLMAEVLARLIRSGNLARQVQLKRREAELRNAIADRALGSFLPRMSNVPGFHRWLPLPQGRTLDALVAQAAQAGITLAAPGTLQQVDRGTLGVRICLGHSARGDDLERALVALRRILETAETMSFV